MTQANNSLTYCAGCGRLIPSSELQAGLSEARAEGVVCIACIERTDPRRAAAIREMSFREAERAKVSVQLMWAPPGVIPPRAARLAGEGAANNLAPGAVDPISGDVGEHPEPEVPTGAANATGGGLLLQGRSGRPARRIPWWVVGVASLLMGVLGAVSQRLLARSFGGGSTTPTAPLPPQPVPPPGAGALANQDGPHPRTIEITPPRDVATAPAPTTPPAPNSGTVPGSAKPAVPPPAAPITTTPATPGKPGAVPAPATSTTPPTPAVPTAEDESRAQALLTSADADFDRAPDIAEKLYATILDFYPTTAAATMARLRASDLAQARDRADSAQLQALFDRAMADLQYETFATAQTECAQLQALPAHGATARQLKEKLGGVLKNRLDRMKADLSANGPLIVGEAINNGNLARAAAIVATLQSFGDPSNLATAAAMRRKIESAQDAEAYRKAEPGLRAQLAVAPLLKSFESSLATWDFPGAGRGLLPTDSDALWKNAGADRLAQMQTLANYFQTRFRDVLVRRAQAVAQTKQPVTLTWQTPQASRLVVLASLAHGAETHTGPLSRVTADALSVMEGTHEQRVEWSRLTADSLIQLAQFVPADGASWAADDPIAAADLIGAIKVFAVARGEITPAAAVGLRDPWEAYCDLRRVVEADVQGEALARDLRRDLDANDVTALLYDLHAHGQLAAQYPTPLAFLSPEGHDLLRDAHSMIDHSRGGMLVFYQDYRLPDRQWKGLQFEALPMRADQRPTPGELLLGARGGTQRVLVRLSDLRIPAGNWVRKAYLRIPVKDATSFKNDGNAVPLDGLTGVLPLTRPFNPGHVSWDFADTLASNRWATPGAYDSTGPEPTPGKLVNAPTGDELLFDLTTYFDSLAKADYADTGYGLLLKVIKNEPDYTITLPDPATTVTDTDAAPAPRLELEIAPKVVVPPDNG